MYTITQYTKDQARKLGVKVRPSTKAHKKIDVVSSDGEVVASVGDVRYADYPTYVKERVENMLTNGGNCIKNGMKRIDMYEVLLLSMLISYYGELLAYFFSFLIIYYDFR